MAGLVLGLLAGGLCQQPGAAHQVRHHHRRALLRHGLPGAGFLDDHPNDGASGLTLVA